MDPLSITAAIIAIAGFTTASLKVILKIRGISDEVQALLNEISDLSAIIKDVEHTLRSSKSLSGPHTGMASLTAVLSKANVTVNHLHAFVDRVLMKEETILGNARISRTAWLKRKPQVVKYQQQLSSIKTELSHALAIANLSSGGRIELSIVKVIALTEESKTLLETQRAETSHIRTDIGSLRDLIDRKTQVVPYKPDLPPFPRPNILPLHSDDVDKTTEILLKGRRRLEVQLAWTPAWACEVSCHCICHELKQSRSPPLFDRFLGILFLGYAGVPMLRKRCDIRDCRRQRGVRFDVSYYFPAWFVDKKIELLVRSMPLGAPQVSIRMANIVSNGALLFKYAHTGDIQGIQTLFSQKAARLSDAGHLDGCTVLHFAVEHGNIPMVDFLLKAGADPYALDAHLESPASYAWDIILGNSMSNDVINFFRAAFSERDFLEEQGFNHIHEIVLGLNGRGLAESIQQWPKLIDSPDSRGNTPMIWAATRGDTQIVQQLLEYGASTDTRNDNGWNALYSAVNNSRLDCVTLLLERGYNGYKDGYGMTALHGACQQPDPAFVQLLLEQDGINLDEQDIFQRCPLALAAWRNNATAVSHLLDRGADREIIDIFGATPLLRAVQYAAPEAASVLLERGCNPLAKDFDEHTLLHRTALSRDIKTMNTLAQKAHILWGIDVNACDKMGKTAREHLDAVEPSADLLHAFTALTTAIAAAAPKQIHRIATTPNSPISPTSPTTWSRGNNTSQEVFEDAKEWPSDRSLASSLNNSDNETTSKRSHRAKFVRIISPLKRASKNWASKYQNTFRSYRRNSPVLDASMSSTRLIDSESTKSLDEKVA